MNAPKKVTPIRPGTPKATGSAGPPEGPSDMAIAERVARLEGAIEHGLEGVRHGQSLLMGVVGAGFALLIAVMSYMITRIDNLPADFERTNQMLSAAITAAKPSPPQVIVVPAATPEK